MLAKSRILDHNRSLHTNYFSKRSQLSGRKQKYFFICNATYIYFTLRLCLILRYFIKSAIIIENSDGFCKPVLSSLLQQNIFIKFTLIHWGRQLFRVWFLSRRRFLFHTSVHDRWLLGSLTCVRVQKKQLVAWTDNSGKYCASTEVVKLNIKRDSFSW